MALYLIIGAAFGFLLGWLFSSSRKKPAADSQIAPQIETELRRQIGDKDGQLAALALREKELIGEKSAAVAERDATKTILAQQQTSHEKALVDLREAFTALSSEALKQNTPEFLRLATDQFAKLQESAKGELAQRQEAISGLLKPLEEHLKTYQLRLQQTESDQSKTLGEVREQMKTLTQRSESLALETEQFRMVLKSSQTRGRWGEETLRRVVEAAGMSPYCDFVEQVQGEDDSRPDLIVKLPGDRVIIVDSKVPDLDFLAALETADLEKRKQSLKAHAEKLKQTIKGLADKDYPSKHANSLDYVVLFLPAESLFSAALEGDRDLILWAGNRKIMLATPASLIGLLRAISMSWDQQKQTENTRAIAEAAQELYARVATFTDHFVNIREGLEKANKALNSAVGSYERMVRPSGERLVKLGVPTGGKELADTNPIETAMKLL